jgi:ABC-2 type transport system permease protein
MKSISDAVPAVICMLAAVLVVYRVRGRRPPPAAAPAAAPPRARGRAAVLAPLLAPLLARAGLADAGLVAAREVRERVRGRVFRVSTALLLAAVAAAIAIPALTKAKAHPQQVAVVGALPAPLRTATTGAAASSGTTAHLVPEPSTTAARRDLRSGRVSLAIVDARQVIVNQPVTATGTTAADRFRQAEPQALGAAAAAQAAGLTPAQATQLAQARPLPVLSLRSAPAHRGTSGAALAGLFLIFLMLTQYNAWTLIGVMQEKSSRVAEVLLAAIRPAQLLGGKVLGIGLAAFTQAALAAALAVGVAHSVGSSLLHGSAPLVLGSTLAWLVLGYAFYCWAYAALGSLAERQDQVQSLMLPLSLPIIFGLLVSQLAVTSGHPTALTEVLAYLPPTAPFAMPALVQLGQVTWWQFAGSAALCVSCTFGLARLALGIYTRAILRTGHRIRLREAVPATAP